LVTSCWLCGTFVLGWLPACIQFATTCNDCLLSNATGTRTLEGMKPIFAISVTSVTFIILKSIVNPIIYAVRIPEIKEQMPCKKSKKEINRTKSRAEFESMRAKQLNNGSTEVQPLVTLNGDDNDVTKEEHLLEKMTHDTV